jgi:hypothetical protein
MVKSMGVRSWRCRGSADSWGSISATDSTAGCTMPRNGRIDEFGARELRSLKQNQKQIHSPKNRGGPRRALRAVAGLSSRR